MVLPLLLGRGAISGFSSAVSAVSGAVRGGRRRKRRTQLTQGQLHELTQIKLLLGKTAAANALPYYLGRR